MNGSNNSGVGGGGYGANSPTTSMTTGSQGLFNGKICYFLIVS